MRDGYRIPIRLFFPEGEGHYPLLIFFHGGGFVKGNIDSYSNVCAVLAKEMEHIVLAVDYRLAPEYPFPIGLEDCYTVVQEVLKNPGVFGITQDEVTVIGDSAGGNLAATLSLLARDRGDLQPKKQVLIYPLAYYDHSDEGTPFNSIRENGTDYLLTSKRIRHYVDLYIPKKEERLTPYFAPLLAKNLANQPETLIITAAYDPLRDEGEAYGHVLREAGNKVEIHRIPDAIHGFFSLPPVFEIVKDSYTLINSFLKRR